MVASEQRLFLRKIENQLVAKPSSTSFTRYTLPNHSHVAGRSPAFSSSRATLGPAMGNGGKEAGTGQTSSELVLTHALKQSIPCRIGTHKNFLNDLFFIFNHLNLLFNNFDFRVAFAQLIRQKTQNAPTKKGEEKTFHPFESFPSFINKARRFALPFTSSAQELFNISFEAVK